MALVKTSRVEDVPRGVEIMNRQEARAHFTNLVYEWENRSEVWPLRYGSSLLGAVSVFSSFYINTHFRRKLKLLHFNKMASYLPTVVIPAFVATACHQTFIFPEILVPSKKAECPTCQQVKAMVIQGSMGVLYPSVLGPLTSFMLATKNYTFRLPGLTENPRELFRIYLKMYRPITTQVSLFLVINAFLAAFLTYKEYESWYNLQLLITEEKSEELRG